MNDTAAQRILTFYGLSGVGLGLTQKGYRNTSYPVRLSDNRLANLILYKNEAKIDRRIQRANAVSDYAYHGGLPTRQTVDRRVVRLSRGETCRYVAIYDYLPGDTIPWEAYTQDHIKLLGLSLSCLHYALKDYPNSASLPSVAGQYEQILGCILEYFNEPPVIRAVQTKLRATINQSVLDRYRLVLTKCGQLPNQQALHMDFVRSNILFETARPGAVLEFGRVSISGILDFEKVAYGHPLFDIARTLAFLLVDCKYKTSRQVYKYFLRSGYAKRGRLPLPQASVQLGPQKVDLFEELVGLFLFYDWYKFLQHNPYESLAQNEHYVRTRNQLLERGVLQMVV
jgi:Ser/Thr protein kinase RdoA (MazF antagonist)